MNKLRKYAFQYSLLIPALVLFSVFRALPLIKGGVLSFQEMNLMERNQWVGLTNYQRLFSDVMFMRSLRTTIIYTLMSVPLMIVVSLFLAMLLNSRVVLFGTFFRAAIFMPYVTSGVVVSIIWKWFLNETYGLVNIVLKLFALPPQRWLTDSTLALLCIMFVSVWKGCGFFMLIFLSNIQMISPEWYEAAAMDGASSWQQFRYITLSQLRPAFLVTVILSTLQFFRAFTVVYTMTGGGPGGSTELLAFHIYKLAVERFEYGLASAGVVVMLLILVTVLRAQIRITEVRQ